MTGISRGIDLRQPVREPLLIIMDRLSRRTSNVVADDHHGTAVTSAVSLGQQVSALLETFADGGHSMGRAIVVKAGLVRSR